jgi:hypothetical protein
MFLDHTMNLRIGNFSKATHLSDENFYRDLDHLNLNYLTP